MELENFFGYANNMLHSILISKVCQKTGSGTYRECWESTMGGRGGLGVALISALLPAQGKYFGIAKCSFLPCLIFLSFQKFQATYHMPQCSVKP